MFSISFGIYANTSEVQLRLQVGEYDVYRSKIFVNVELKYDQGGSINLASQNYRFYYNSDALHLRPEDSAIQLGSDYGDLVFEESREGIDVDDVNQLDFDDNLGFANFSIALINNNSGGYELSSNEGWVSVATLVFDLQQEADTYDIVWGRDGITDDYATAFVKIGEWKNARTEETVEVEFFGDLDLDRKEIEKLANPIEVKFGPNPSTEYVQIDFGQELPEVAQIRITDITGRSVLTETVASNQTFALVEVDGLQAANYIMHIDMGDVSLTKETLTVIR